MNLRDKSDGPSGRIARGALAAIACGALLASPALAQEDPRPAAALQDNSFLIEEAYNQEPGVVQHILSLRRQGHDWFLNFTQEWPLASQMHQFSYSVPYSWLRTDTGRVSGVGDATVNYRIQLMTENDWRPAFAPRISLIVPSGDASRDLGAGSFGYQVALPFSKIVTDRLTLHANFGVTSYWDIFGQQPISWFAGGSAIYAVTREFNLMLETLHEWNESVNPTGLIEREKALTVLPGFRYAFNLPAGQLVTGVGAPIRFVEGAKPDYGVFLYLSFEHGFLGKKK